MKVITLNEKQLDEFAERQSPSQLLQSSVWAKFQQKFGHKTWLAGLANDQGELMASAVIIEQRLPLQKSYLYCPRGPVVDKNQSINHTDIVKLFLKEARDISIETKTEEEIFFRFEPTFNFNQKEIEALKTKDIQPSLTLLLDLKSDEEILSKNLHQKTRYNINLAEKKGVQVELRPAEKFPDVWPLFNYTSTRNNFNLHAQNYYQLMLNTSDNFKLWTASLEEKIIAAAIVGYYGNTVTYLHGASDYRYREIMAPNLLQWQIIKRAKSQNYKYYDFHGIAPQGQPNHPWVGITRFKKGFGGKEIAYPGTFDFIYQPEWYRIYKIFRKLNLLFKKNK